MTSFSRQKPLKWKNKNDTIVWNKKFYHCAKFELYRIKNAKVFPSVQLRALCWPGVSLKFVFEFVRVLIAILMRLLITTWFLFICVVKWNETLCICFQLVGTWIQTGKNEARVYAQFLSLCPYKIPHFLFSGLFCQHVQSHVTVLAGYMIDPWQGSRAQGSSWRLFQHHYRRILENCKYHHPTN